MVPRARAGGDQQRRRAIEVAGPRERQAQEEAAGDQRPRVGRGAGPPVPGVEQRLGLVDAIDERQRADDEGEVVGRDVGPLIVGRRDDLGVAPGVEAPGQVGVAVI
ncbi:MAG: hypothetical protein IPL61_24305 [Myxococcales bacterium]|nr:hypothetical protein [Myxococcales bacterium]